MGQTQSAGSTASSTAVLTSEVAVTGLIIVAGVWFFKNQALTVPNALTTEGGVAGKKGKKKNANKDKKRSGMAGGLESSIDTLVQESSADEGAVSTSYPLLAVLPSGCACTSIHTLLRGAGCLWTQPLLKSCGVKT